VSIEAYQRFSTWIRTDRIAYANGTAEAKALAAAYTGRDPFSAGKAFARFRSVTDLKTYQRQVGGDFEWDVIGVPKQGNQVGVSMTAGHPHIIWARTRYPDQAFEFTRFLALPDAQEQIGRSHITVPALKTKMGTFFDPPPAPHASIFMDVYKKPRGIHFRHHNTPENWDQYGQAVTPLLVGDRPLVAGLQELNQQMNAKIEYGTCSPYKGLKHPLPPGI
jgi:ABC-type glycerol-3-phosphate transport system substrate-binding protein